MTNEELNAIIAKAEAGDVAAMNQLGQIYGQDEYKDLSKAFYWINKSAEIGDILGMSNLGGWCYLYGNGTEKNIALAIEWLEKAAEKGYVWSINKLAHIYSDDAEFRNAEKAFFWYKKGAEAGDVNCMSCLGGWCYLWANGTERNIALAIEWLEKAAEKGDVWSMERLTYNIYSQDNEFKDYDKACIWFEKIRASDPFGWRGIKLEWDWLEKAAAEGNGNAMVILGKRCEREDKVEEAVSWFKKGAEAGDIQSMRELAWCYRTGKGVEENKSLALGLYEKAANAGDIQSMTDIVSLCQYDDKEKHDFWQKKAADAGNSWAQYYMGEDCVQKQDYDNAISWYVKSAQSRRDGDTMDAASRMNALGVEFQYGNNGRTIDLSLAFRLYENAAEFNNADAIANLANCYANGINVEKDFKKCFEWYTKAAELGNQFGYSNLGWCYMYGNGIDKNVPEAIKWLTKAADEFGNIWSMNRLTDIYGTFEGYINQEQAAKWFLELIKRDCDPNSGVYEKTGYNKDLYAKVKNAVLSSTTEGDMMLSLTGSTSGGSLLGGAVFLASSEAKSYINQAEEIIKHNETEKAKKKEVEKANLISQIEKDYRENDRPFRWKFSGETFVIPEGTKRIGSFVFRFCSATSFVIPEGVMKICEGAFESCSFSSITIPNSVRFIERHAFFSCGGLKYVTLGENIVSVGDSAFFGSRLDAIIVPKGTKQRYEQMDGLRSYKDIIVEE